MSNYIPYFSFNNVPTAIKQEWKNEINSVIEDGLFINGPRLNIFESNWSSILNMNYSIGVGNGFDGLVLALESMGIGPNDQVLVPAHTFIATWFAVQRVGAIPVGVDVDGEGLLSIDQILEAEIKKIKESENPAQQKELLAAKSQELRTLESIKKAHDDIIDAVNKEAKELSAAYTDGQKKFKELFVSHEGFLNQFKNIDQIKKYFEGLDRKSVV